MEFMLSNVCSYDFLWNVSYPWKPGPGVLDAVFTSVSRLKRLKRYIFCFAEMPAAGGNAIPTYRNHSWWLIMISRSFWISDDTHGSNCLVLSIRRDSRGVGDAERALDTLNYSSIRGRSRLRQKGWALAGGFGTLPLWSFNVIEFIALWVWACKSFQVPHYVEPTSLDEHPVFFFVISGFAFAFASVPDSRLTLHG